MWIVWVYTQMLCRVKEVGVDYYVGELRLRVERTLGNRIEHMSIAPASIVIFGEICPFSSFSRLYY